MICVLRPSGDFLYVDDSLNDTIDAFAVDQTTGALTPLSGSPFRATGKDLSVAVDPLGRYLFTGNWFLANISVFSIGSSGTLAPVPGSPFFTPFNTHNDPGGGLVVASDPSGHFLYATAGQHNEVIGYTIDQSTGSLAQIPGTPLPTGGHPFGLIVSPWLEVLTKLLNHSRWFRRGFALLS